LLRLHR